MNAPPLAIAALLLNAAPLFGKTIPAGPGPDTRERVQTAHDEGVKLVSAWIAALPHKD